MRDLRNKVKLYDPEIIIRARKFYGAASDPASRLGTDLGKPTYAEWHPAILSTADIDWEWFREYLRCGPECFEHEYLGKWEGET